ncbi:PucR family transcriptional regulator [Nocardioides sp.]|uniref:PucR family transcriptional regulator n=1 Tax=Nocardioides sp. TaxID=35761 RepID=UPI003526DB13
MASLANGADESGQQLIAEPGQVDLLAEELAQLVLAGAELADLVGTIGRALDAEVLVTTTDGRERAAHLDPCRRERLAEAGLTDETGRIRVELLDDEAGDIGSPLPGLSIHKRPVASPQQPLGHLVVVAGRQLDDDGLTALRRAATAVALSITRDQAVSAVENKYRADFLRDVFLGRAGTTEFVREHVHGFGWDLGGAMLVLVAQLDPQASSPPFASIEEQRQWQDRFAHGWRRVAEAIDPALPVADFGSEVVTVLPAEDPDAAATLVRRMVHAVAGDKGGGRRSFTAGVGRAAQGVAGLPDSYAQARRAVDVGRRLRGPGTTAFFDELGLHRLIAMVPDLDELRSFAHDVLGELAAPTEEAASLRETLQVLLNTNFNVAEAARTQFFHYNTMRYRVGKLERLLGPIASDQNLRLDAAVALQVLEVVTPDRPGVAGD